MWLEFLRQNRLNKDYTWFDNMTSLSLLIFLNYQINRKIEDNLESQADNNIKTTSI